MDSRDCFILRRDLGDHWSAGQTFGLPMGQSAGPFAPNQPAVAILKGRNMGNSNGISWDIGFDLAVPWDGTSADCTGQWWAIWQLNSPVPSAPTNHRYTITTYPFRICVYGHTDGVASLAARSLLPSHQW